MRSLRKSLVLIVWLMICVGHAVESEAQNRWFASIYGGRFSDNALLDILRFQTEIGASNIYVLSIAKELGRYENKLVYEFEGQLGFHQGEQSNEEINAVFVLRWLPLPWDRWVDSSIAVGSGLSYATTEPPLEKLDQKDNKSSHVLYYFSVEIAFEPFRRDDWDLFIRVHHRSGIFGLIHGIDSGSNFIGFGVRYHFSK